MYMSYSRKRIIKVVKFLLQNFVGLARTLLKKYYPIPIIWYAKLAPTRRKSFIGCESVRSHPANHQLTGVKPQEYKLDPEVSLNHDDLYARACQ